MDRSSAYKIGTAQSPDNAGKFRHEGQAKGERAGHGRFRRCGRAGFRADLRRRCHALRDHCALALGQRLGGRHRHRHRSAGGGGAGDLSVSWPTRAGDPRQFAFGPAAGAGRARGLSASVARRTARPFRFALHARCDGAGAGGPDHTDRHRDRSSRRARAMGKAWRCVSGRRRDRASGRSRICC